ncbi:hypothetical protein D3C73_1385770 [compost metagenome]
MKVPADKGDDGKPFVKRPVQNVDTREAVESVQQQLGQLPLPLAQLTDAHLFLERDGERGLGSLQEAGSSPILSLFFLLQIRYAAPPVRPQHRPSSGEIRDLSA